MFSKIFFLLLVIAISGILAAPQGDLEEPERQCQVGKSYHDGCNSCFCSSGKFTACTYKLCLTTGPDGKIMEVPRLPPPEDFWVS